MADSEFDILIRFGLSKDAATQAQNELKKIKDQSIDTGKEGVRQEQLVEQATQKTFTSKKQLKDMVKQLGHEFPLLGTIGRLALNPIAFTTAAITGAFVIWNKRVQELTTSLGGIEMPDIGTTATERINIHAAAWGILAQKMADAANASGRIKSRLAEALETIKANEDLFKAMGIEVGTKGDSSRAERTSAAAAALRASGSARIARAGTPGSKESEDALAAKFAAEAAAAELAKKEATGRLGDILGLSDLSGAPRIIANTKYLMRYGGMDPAQAEALERGNIQSQQDIIERAGRFSLSSASRAVRRGEIAGGKADLLEADRLGGSEVTALLRQIANGVAGRAPLPQNAPGNLDEVIGFMAAMTRFAANLPALTASIERANQNLKNTIQRP